MTHGKLKAKEIVKMECEILKTLCFNTLRFPSLYVMIEFLLVKINFHLFRGYKDIKKVVTYISKMLMHDYDIIS